MNQESPGFSRGECQDAALWALQAWADARGDIAEPLETALFVNSTGTRMSRQGFWKRIKKYAEEAGIKKKVSPHALRATFAVHMIENGAGMEAIQELLGVNRGAAAKYRNMVQARRLRDTLESCHPQAMKESAVDGKQNVSV